MAKTAKYIAVLGMTLAAVSVAAGAVASRRYGANAYTASAVAALINWFAGATALLTVALCRDKPWRSQSVLLAMAVRMAPVLVAAAFFMQTGHPLAASGVAGLIVVHYLVGLVVETFMSVRLLANGAATPLSPGGKLLGAGGNSETRINS